MSYDQADLEQIRASQIGRFARILALAVVIAAILPALIGWVTAPPGSLYFGIQTNLDDHMVYAAWMRQAMEGRFLFDNRFTTDPQPGLTINLYFFVLGGVAKLIGIPLAMLAARVGLSYFFVRLLGRFLTAIPVDVFVAKAALLLVTFGGGIGFMAWEKFGQEYVNGSVRLKPLFAGLAPIDVWQPEAFVFPSMLTNGLFMVSLCLILGVLRAAVEARHSWKPVLGGALCFGVLMNIHSYDALLLTLVLIAFAVGQLAQKRASLAWAGRVATIGAGALPAAAWFIYVLSKDPVFQARAATLTYSANFRQVLFGLLPLVGLGLFALWKAEAKHRLASTALAVLVVGLLLTLSASAPGNQYLLGAGAWLGLFAVVLAAVAMAATKDDCWTLACAWALASLVAVYFPALFQRKLAMGLAVPWGILAAYGVKELLHPLEKSTRNLVSTLVFCLCGATSILWFMREIHFVRNNVGSTTVHPVYFSRDSAKIIDALNAIPGRKVVLAMPGVWNPVGPADFATPQMPDLNPVLSGLTASYTYAGHWSETPDYNRRRSQTTAVFLGTTPPDRRAALLAAIGADYIVAPNTSAFPTVRFGEAEVPIADLSGLGETVYEGSQLSLIRLRH